MSKRQFSMKEYWNRRAAEIQPALSYRTAGLPFPEWQEAARNKLLELLGPFPDKVPLEAEIDYEVEQEGYVRRRVVFDSEENMSVPCQVLLPLNAPRDRSLPAIVCSHGHCCGQKYGKDPVTGIISEPDAQAAMAEMNYNFAEQMVRAGFVTIVPDLRGFGERSDGGNPFPGRDACNIHYLKGSIMGVNPLMLNIWDMKCCIDYLETMEEVDPNRIGMMGLSYGGTMTTFTTAVEPRIKAANIMGYVNSFARFGIDRANFCGMQVLPELYRWLDTFDIAGLIAPRPLLLDMGIYDGCFPFQDLWAGYQRVKEIYDAAGAFLDTDVHPHGHSFGGNKAFEFFRKYL